MSERRFREILRELYRVPGCTDAPPDSPVLAARAAWDAALRAAGISYPVVEPHGDTSECEILAALLAAGWQPPEA